MCSAIRTFGVRNDSLVHLDFQEKFFKEVLFPYIDKHDIKRIYQLGDLMDRRKFVNFHTLHRCKKFFIEPARERGMEVFIQVGNHDIYYRDSLKINALHELFYGYDHLKLIEQATTLEDESLDIIPWICKENKKEIEQFIKNSKSKYLLGHLELAGFDMMRGMKSEHGDDPADFSRYESVISGHYHTRSNSGNIQYLGIPYEITWADSGDQKGFGAFDSDTGILEFVPNPYTIFSKIIYDDRETDYDTVDVKQFLRTYIKIIIAKKTDEKKFDAFLERLYQFADPIDLSISDTTLSYREVEQEKIETRDPLTILVSSVDETMVDSAEIQRMIQELYSEAMTMGTQE